MSVTLEEAKLYLRLTGDSEDTLITSFIFTAEELCESILRYPLSELSVIPECIKLAIYYAVSCFYEQREKVDTVALISVMKHLISNYRQESW